MPKKHVVKHRDGSVWGRGYLRNGKPDGYWEWFRTDGTKMRSGHFKNGQNVGEWITYDHKGKVYKVTTLKPKKS